MSKLLVVFGATGQQGGSVVSHVLDDPELSSQYRIRAITRDASSSSAEKLKKRGVEVVSADSTNPSTLTPVLKDAHTVFGMVVPAWGPGGKEKELASGKAIADMSVQSGVSYLIFSVLPHISKLSGGKFTKVSSFDAQAEVEEHIRSLPIRSAFFSPGSFMQNFANMMTPKPAEDGTYSIWRPVSPQCKLPLIDTAGDTGKYVSAILAEPDKFEGKKFCAASGVYTMEEQAQIISKVTGKTVKFNPADREDFLKVMPPWGESLLEMMEFQQEFGYYGPETDEKVAWAVENARGKVHSFEEFLKENPLPLA